MLAERNRGSILPPHDVTRETPARTSFSGDLNVLTVAGFVVDRVAGPGLERALFPRMSYSSRFLTVAPTEIRRWRDATYPTDPGLSLYPQRREGRRVAAQRPDVLEF